MARLVKKSPKLLLTSEGNVHPKLSKETALVKGHEEGDDTSCGSDGLKKGIFKRWFKVP